MTQLLLEHECFRAYLHMFKHEDSPYCPTYLVASGTAEHAFFDCPRFVDSRLEVLSTLEEKMSPDSFVSKLQSDEAYKDFSCVAARIMKSLRCLERATNTNHSTCRCDSILKITAFAVRLPRYVMSSDSSV